MVGKWRTGAHICQGNTQTWNVVDTNEIEQNCPKVGDAIELKGMEKVESLLEKRGYKYLVKWKNCSEASNSWEARFALPQLIVKVKHLFSSPD